MSEGSTEKTHAPLPLHVKLKPIDHSDQPLLAKYTRIGIAQGIAYLDFGFLEPVVLTSVVRHAQNGGHVPKNVEGRLTSRIAVPLEAAIRLHQQLQHVLLGLRKKTGTKI